MKTFYAVCLTDADKDGEPSMYLTKKGDWSFELDNARKFKTLEEAQSEPVRSPIKAFNLQVAKFDEVKTFKLDTLF